MSTDQKPKMSEMTKRFTAIVTAPTTVSDAHQAQIMCLELSRHLDSLSAKVEAMEALAVPAPAPMAEPAEKIVVGKRYEQPASKASGMDGEAEMMERAITFMVDQNTGLFPDKTKARYAESIRKCAAQLVEFTHSELRQHPAPIAWADGART